MASPSPKTSRIEIWRQEVALHTHHPCTCPPAPSTSSSSTSSVPTCPVCSALPPDPELELRIDSPARTNTVWRSLRSLARRVRGRQRGAVRSIAWDERERRLKTDMYAARAAAGETEQVVLDVDGEPSVASGEDVARGIQERQARLRRAERLLGRMGS